jgi:DNA-binding response OmpR family regulator
MEEPKHILVVERDQALRQTLCEMLVDLGYRVTGAGDAKQMRAVLAADGVHLIVVDATMSEREEFSVASDAKERGIRLVMVSGNPETMQLFQDRVDQLLWKPFGRKELERAVDFALASKTFGQRTEDSA